MLSLRYQHLLNVATSCKLHRLQSLSIFRHALEKPSIAHGRRVLGLSVYKDRNLPWMRPSLFMPLAAVLHQAQSGVAYAPAGRSTLNLFNMHGFKGGMEAIARLGHVPIVADDGSMFMPGPQGGPVLTLGAALGAPPALTAQRPASGIAAAAASGSGGGGGGGGGIVGGVGRLPAGTYGPAPPAASGSGSVHSAAQQAAVTGTHYPAAAGAVASTPPSATAAAATASSSGAMRQGVAATSRSGLAGFEWPALSGPGSSNEAVTSSGGGGGSGSTPAVDTSNWNTPIARLLMSDPRAKGGVVKPPEALWWLLTHKPTTADVTAGGGGSGGGGVAGADAGMMTRAQLLDAVCGPVTPETLLLAYSQGLIEDNVLVCGVEWPATTAATGAPDEREQGSSGSGMAGAGANPSPTDPPGAQHFTSLKDLIEAAQKGQTYRLQPAHDASATTPPTALPTAPTSTMPPPPHGAASMADVAAQLAALPAHLPPQP
jgi:hypothetical protein